MTLFEKNMDMEQPGLGLNLVYPDEVDFSDLKPEDIFEMEAVTERVADFKLNPRSTFERYRLKVQGAHGNYVTPENIYVFPFALPSGIKVKIFCFKFSAKHQRFGEGYMNDKDTNIILPQWMIYKARNLCMAKKNTPLPEPRTSPEPF